MILGLKYAWALAQLGEINAALDAFEDMVSVVEKVMSIQDDEFKLGCNSPALKGFALNCNFYWLDKNGKEYRELYLESNGWNEWIVPVNLLHDVTSDCWFGSSGIDDARWDTLLERLRKCIIVKDRDK